MTKVCPNPSAGCTFDPLVSFWYDRENSGHTPSVEEYTLATRAFRQRYPFVRLYTSWNEVNKKLKIGTGLFDSFALKPFLAGQLWSALNAERHPAGAPEQCIVAGGSFIDSGPNLNGRPTTTYDGPAGSKTYFRGYVQGMGFVRPPAWAFHPYSTINRRLDAPFKDFLAATRATRNGVDVSPNIWVTEVGAFLRLKNATYDPRNREGQRQQDAVRYLVGNSDTQTQGLIQRFDRISRVYYYPWRGDVNQDAGLTSYRKSSTVRPAYYCLRLAINPQAGDAAKCAEDT